jgi:hypothetical protein
LNYEDGEDNKVEVIPSIMLIGPEISNYITLFPETAYDEDLLPEENEK